MRALLLSFLLGLLAGCGGDDGDENPAATAFIGTWTTTTATQTVSECLIADQIGDKQNVALTWTVAKSPDASADVVLTSNSLADCTLKAKVADKKATLVSGNTCKVAFNDKYDHAYTFSGASTFELGPDGKTATFNLQATFDEREKSGSPTGYTCAFTENAPLTKS
ncbi:MAG: hypothetical protein KIT84_00160 [Labilithrix sp.]|nr:hypothetical protein [Labilithrix sp.]MCW5809395.1 hypothetical protein [Labilithrix sp.]